MSKALVIKNADFSANKVTTVVFNDIPCTGITISESTLSITSRDGNTLIATVTPLNTTDPILWSSSDESVLTVNNGALTILGNGNCIVTVSCGSYSASCSVTVGLIENPHLEIGFMNVANAASGGTNNLILLNGNSANIICLANAGNSNGFDAAISRISIPNQYFPQYSLTSGIRIPNNARYLRVKCDSVYRSDPGAQIWFIDGETTDASANDPSAIGYSIVQHRAITPPATMIVDSYIEIPANVNGYVASFIIYPSSTVKNVTYNSYSDLENLFVNTLHGSIQYYTELPEGATAYTADLQS